MISDKVRTEFLSNTDETGRHIVTSARTGRSYFVEPIVTEQTPKWGSIDPATGNLMNKKGHDKYTGGVKPSESLINIDNGFDKVHEIGHGVSPWSAIELLDAAYPDKV